MKCSIYDKTSIPRLYVNEFSDEEKVYITLSPAGTIKITSPSDILKEKVRKLLEDNNIETKKVPSLDGVLGQLKQIKTASSKAEGKSRSKFPNNRKYEDLKNTKTPKQLSEEAGGLDISTVGFLVSTIKNSYIKIDHREPKALQDLMQKCKIEDVQVVTLPLGDILIGSKDGKKELLIERKTITDLCQNIKSDDKHAHDQVEKSYSYKQQKAKEGVAVKIIWIIEGEDEGSRMLYNILPRIEQVDGWIGYCLAISDQYMVNTFNVNHTAYMAAKIGQCFLERKLTNPVKTDAGQRIDTAKQISLRKEVPLDEDTDRGVVSARSGVAQMLSFFPSIPMNVAKELANTGKSIKQITAMSNKELLDIKGVGDKRASDIFNDFNQKQ
ncbi:MAG: ERCC4-type nuclease [Paraglaciecola sp.]|jgi:ERCC4-type nuclease